MSAIDTKLIQELDRFSATATDGRRTVEVGLFIDEEWQGGVPLRRRAALQLYADLQAAIREKWPQALPRTHTQEQITEWLELLGAASAWISSHRAAEEADERAGTDDLLQEMEDATARGVFGEDGAGGAPVAQEGPSAVVSEQGDSP